MNAAAAARILRAFQTGRALFVTDDQVFAANDAFIDAGDYANAAKLQTLAGLYPDAGRES